MLSPHTMFCFHTMAFDQGNVAPAKVEFSVTGAVNHQLPVAADGLMLRTTSMAPRELTAPAPCVRRS